MLFKIPPATAQVASAPNIDPTTTTTCTSDVVQRKNDTNVESAQSSVQLNTDPTASSGNADSSVEQKPAGTAIQIPTIAPSTQILIRGLPPQYSAEAVIRKIFEKHGTVVRVDNAPQNHQALCRFTTIEEAKNAISAVNGRMLAGCRLVVQFCTKIQSKNVKRRLRELSLRQTMSSNGGENPAITAEASDGETSTEEGEVEDLEDDDSQL